MEFVFKIFWAGNGSLEPLLEPAPVCLSSIERARDLAKNFAAYAPVHSITIETQDGSIFERWCWLNETWRSDQSTVPELAIRPSGKARTPFGNLA